MATNFTQAKAFLEQLIGRQMASDNLVREALDANVNVRLALYGDKILDAALFDDWYSSGATKGKLLPRWLSGMSLTFLVHAGIADNMRQSRHNNPYLANLAIASGLDVHVTRKVSQRNQPASAGTLATTVEAIVGAIYLDSGKDLEAVKRAIVAMGL